MRIVSICCRRTLLILAAGMLVLSNAAAQAPANDECSGATVIGSLPFNAAQNSRLATPNAADPALPCADGGGGKTVWFVYTASTTQFVTFSTAGSTPAEYDIAMGVFVGTCDNLSLFACNDDISPGIIRQSEITVPVQAGAIYYVHVAEWAGGGPAGGTPTGGDLVFNALVPVVPPIAAGPKTGAVPSGVAVSTDPYQPESPFYKVSQVPLRINKPRKHLPDPLVLTPPAASRGSNYIESRVEKSSLAGSTPVVFRHFSGVPDQGVSIPPDPDLAVGPNHVIAVVNSRFRIYDKAGTLLKTVEADQWFAPVPPGNWGPFDPQVIYDHHAGRWVMTWAHAPDTLSATILISVSDDENPLGTWYSWATPSNALGDSAVAQWDDYPQLGYDAEAVYVTGRMFPLGTLPTPFFCRLRIFPKSSLYSSAGGVLNWFDLWDFRDPANPFVAPDGLQSSIMFGNPGVHFLMTDSPYETGTYFSIWTITNPATSPSVTGMYVPVTEFLDPSNAGQLGGGALPIEAGGRRLRSNPVYRDSSLWAVHSIASGSSSQYSAARYVRINPFTGALLEDAAIGAEGFWHYYPALMPDQNNSLIVTFSRSGETEYAGAFVAGRKEGDPPGLSASVAVKAGEGNYVKDFSSGRNRWGDYNGIALDPVDNDAVWVHTEYAGLSNRWGNEIGMVKMAPLPGTYVRAEPEFLRYSGQEAGTASQADTIVLYNPGNDPLSISSIGYPGPDFTYAGASLSLPYVVPSFGSLMLPFTFTPTGAGDIVDSVVIVSNAGNQPNLVLRLEGRGIVVNPATPGQLYASGGPSSPTFYTLNLATGAAASVGGILPREIQGMTIRPSTGIIYGTTASTYETLLSRVNPTTGEIVQSVAVPLGNMRAIAFSPGDTLYGATVTGQLYRVNLATGDTAFVGTARGIQYSSLAFDPTTGVLWASIRPSLGAGKDRIYTVNTSNGDTTIVGNTTLNVITPGITFDPAGNLYAVVGSGVNPSQLYRLSKANANATLIGPTGTTGIGAVTMRPDSLVTGIAGNPAGDLPARYSLGQNYPNPFNPSTRIRFSVPVRSQIQLTVYDILGREVSRLLDGIVPAGTHTSVWDGRTASSAAAPTGVYFYKLMATPLEGSGNGGADSFTETGKMVLTK